MGAMISLLCENQEEKKKKEIEESLIRREVRAEVVPSKRHLKREDTLVLPDKSCISPNITKSRYTIMEQVGKGSYGNVQRASLKFDRSIGRSFAVKTIEKGKYIKEIRRFLREIEILKNLDHPNIIRFFEAYESKNAYFIVQEFCGGGDLGQIFEMQCLKFNEDDARDFMWQIMLAINYLHSKGIAHRDIKPENFLLLDKTQSTLKLIDFGLSATLCSGDETSKETCGSPFYMAPEVLEKNYTCLCDVWSAGVILFNFMTCKFPFDAETNDQVFELVKRGSYDREAVKEANYSPQAVELLDLMLRREVSGRITAKDALQHPWFERKRDEVKRRGQMLLNKEMLLNLKSFCYRSMIQREMVGLIIQETDLTVPEIKRIQDVFMYLDEDLSGTISPEEIENIYKKYEIPLKEGEIEDIIDSLYFKEKAVVTFLEFIAATIDKSFYLDRKRIQELFSYIDVDESGEIDYKDIQDCFKRFGRLLDDSKINRMISECDTDKDNKINFNEFYSILTMEKTK